MEDYDIVSQLGAGAQGTVLRVLHRSSGQERAMKVIKCRDQEQLNFALKEIKVLLQLRNPNVVSYIDFFVLLNHCKTMAGYLESQPTLSVCLVMELCSEENLEDRIRLAKRHFMETGGHANKQSEILTWMKQGAEALKYIHDRGFLHRDMKPTNVLFSSDGHLKLGDFGVATSAGLGKESTVGSPHYFAPELLLKQSYNNKVDVWGLGIVFLELLTLRERPINSQLLADPQENETVVADVVGMGFSHALGLLVKDMLARHPDGRPSTAAIIARIEKLMSNLSSSVIPIPSVVPTVAVCQVCEVDTAVVFCSSCKQCFCDPCEIARHKHPQRQNHERRRMALPTAPQSVIRTRQKIQVPSAGCASLEAALQICSTMASGQTVEIFVESGLYTLGELRVPKSFPVDLLIEGINPSPVLEINSSGSCLVVEHVGKCTVRNISINQVSRSPPKADSRPCVVELLNSNWVFENCKFSSEVGSGAIVSGDEAQPVFEHCHFQGIKQIGVLFTDRSKGTVRKCRFSACEHSGILVRKASAPSIVECTIACGKETGIYCHESSPLIEKAVVESNGGCGIVAKGAGAAPRIQSCKIMDNYQAGIFCSDSAKPFIDSCEVLFSRKVGVLVKASASVVVERSVINSGKEAGLYVFDGAKARIINSTITGNANSGILVATKGYVECIGNVIRQNGYEGIWVCKGGMGQFTENDVRGNTKGPRDVEPGCVVQWRNNQED